MKKYLAAYVPLAILFCIAAFFAHKNYFIQDDAYIAFVYAKNFANGHGLVWYPGSDEYGYTSFLYTLVVGIFMAVLRGVDPEYISATLNFTAYIAALALTYLLTWRLTNAKLAGACAVLALATHHTFSAYASGGLETMAVTALVMGFYYALFLPPLRGEVRRGGESGSTARASLTPHPNPPPQGGRELTLGLLAACALLTRLDSAILLFPGYVYLLFRHCEEIKATKQFSNCHAALVAASPGNLTKTPQQVQGDNIIKRLAMERYLWIAAAIPTLAVIALLTWAYSYYGYALPNTFYAKMPGDQSMAWLGRRYILKYLELHHYIPAWLGGIALLAMAYIAIIKKRWRDTTPLLCLAATIALWLCYVIHIGGDFMEFRLFVPVLPMFAAGVFAALAHISLPNIKKSAIALLLGVLCFANYQHLQRNGLNIGVIASTKFLNHYAVRAHSNWRIIGKALNNLLYEGTANDVVLATFPAGMIPFYSGLKSIDVYGLNTRAIFFYPELQNPRRRLSIPGHRILGNDRLLEQAQVNLNIYHPQPLCKNKQGKYVRGDHGWSYFPYKRYRSILIPVSEKCYLAADYSRPHPRIEALLANGDILDYREHQDRFQCPRWLCLS